MIKNKKGAIILMIDLLIIPIFATIMLFIIDATNIFYLNKHLKSSLDLATKSGIIFEDKNRNHGILEGKIYVDETLAKQHFNSILKENLNTNKINITSNKLNNSLSTYVSIYNDFNKTNYPNSIPKDVLGNYSPFQIVVDRPTVFGVAKIKYKTFYGKEIEILKYSSCQISNINIPVGNNNNNNTPTTPKYNTGEVVKLGTLHVGGSKLVTNSSSIPKYSTNQPIEIKDTDTSDTYKINWIAVNDGAKKLLIADRNLLTNISWDDLNNQGLISGKTITIDGQQYKLRVLTGGSNHRIIDNIYRGGIPIDNEWDRIICNEGGFTGLPTPNSTDLDNNKNETDRLGTHNSKWNWYDCWSWVQEIDLHNSSRRICRGWYCANSLNKIDSDYSNSNTMGWRPVLEVLNTTN